MAAPELEEQLRSFLEEAAARYDIEIDPEAYAVLLALIRAGVERMRDEDVRYDSPQIATAQQNFALLLGGAFEEARGRSLDPQVLEMVWRRLCPGLWPFC